MKGESRTQRRKRVLQERYAAHEVKAWIKAQKRPLTAADLMNHVLFEVRRAFPEIKYGDKK